jgi:hypothetical protein
MVDGSWSLSEPSPRLTMLQDVHPVSWSYRIYRPKFLWLKKDLPVAKSPNKIDDSFPRYHSWSQEFPQQVVNPKFVPENLIEIAEVTDVTIFFLTYGCLTDAYLPIEWGAEIFNLKQQNPLFSDHLWIIIMFPGIS